MPVYLEPSTIEMIDGAADARGMNRSEFIKYLFERYATENEQAFITPREDHHNVELVDDSPTDWKEMYLEQ